MWLTDVQEAEDLAVNTVVIVVSSPQRKLVGSEVRELGGGVSQGQSNVLSLSVGVSHEKKQQTKVEGARGGEGPKAG